MNGEWHPFIGIMVLLASSACGGEDAVFSPTGGQGGATAQTGSGAGAAGGNGSGGAGPGSGGATATGGAGQGGFDPAQDPSVTIYHPGDMECRVVNLPIPCSGIATDPQQGMLAGSSLVWSSTLEGQLGTGSPITWTPTTLGTHALILSATDSDANIGSAQVAIEVQQQCP